MKLHQKLICVDDSIKEGQEGFVSHVYKQWVKKGEEYTIREILDNDGIVTGVLLKEIHNAPIYIHLLDTIQEPAFRITRFRVLNQFEKEEEKDYIEEIIKKNYGTNAIT